MDKKTLESLKNILIYMWNDEEEDYKARKDSNETVNDHIYLDIKNVLKWVKGHEDIIKLSKNIKNEKIS